ncbi:MAG: hypothetical protein US40_C0005G0023 [Candidatus Roizmanbacteria bacterium GW2011_GWC2_37_13]|uniref:Uncharacterized protein n=1 Tax=Candidatus Roizmanbacteria bacterium GW2011_GWC2_37_13 TaxID=1618486 RepID=A0A0G0G405_9BACT|nr:MAG: hypothetical protein US38_C0005G0023 [Candidatus Roizmanbacteria bacterium GW2011_GWC1_37_12]KKQ25853.1 MAG: hypothetical protein US40_C0005G0023 [Candidatus Roizmanbacteria bacterium GW2011_GWC2_37_13]
MLKMTNFKSFFYQEITFLKSFYVWILCMLIFFSILLFSNGSISDFWSVVLVIVFVIGVMSFLAIFIKISLFLFQKPLRFICTVFQRKINKKIIIVFISLSILLFTFYWFQIRPAQIKANCQIESDEYYKREFDRKDIDKDGLILTDSIDRLNKYAKVRYEKCLHRNGL